eukprot:c25580_g4_i1 orf=391-639(+)
MNTFFTPPYKILCFYLQRPHDFAVISFYWSLSKFNTSPCIHLCFFAGVLTFFWVVYILLQDIRKHPPLEVSSGVSQAIFSKA